MPSSGARAVVDVRHPVAMQVHEAAHDASGVARRPVGPFTDARGRTSRTHASLVRRRPLGCHRLHRPARRRVPRPPPRRWAGAPLGASGGAAGRSSRSVRAALGGVDPARRTCRSSSATARTARRSTASPRTRASSAPPSAPTRIHGARARRAPASRRAPTTAISPGEPQFVRAMIDAHHERAGATGARIVHCCGYDSIPSDLGTLVLAGARARRARDALRRREVLRGRGEGRHQRRHGGEHGRADGRGRARSAACGASSTDPYALDPGRRRARPRRADQRGVAGTRTSAQWTGPFLMAAINTRVVRRSNALLGYAWGEDFRYREAMSFGAGAKGWMRAAGVSAARRSASRRSRPARCVASWPSRFLPSPGEGPSKEVRDAGFFVSRLVGTMPRRPGQAPRRRPRHERPRLRRDGEDARRVRRLPRQGQRQDPQGRRRPHPRVVHGHGLVDRCARRG